jgi:hypothetical protein
MNSLLYNIHTPAFHCYTPIIHYYFTWCVYPTATLLYITKLFTIIVLMATYSGDKYIYIILLSMGCNGWMSVIGVVDILKLKVVFRI